MGEQEGPYLRGLHQQGRLEDPTENGERNEGEKIDGTKGIKLKEAFLHLFDQEHL